MDDHEQVLVDLCSDPTFDLKETDECIVSFLKEGYNLDDAVDESDDDEVNGGIVNGKDDEATNGDSEEDGDALVANMYSMWADDMESQLPAVDLPLPTEKEDSKAKPWSSRSSGSGTYVRNPTTGEMTNIDA